MTKRFSGEYCKPPSGKRWRQWSTWCVCPWSWLPPGNTLTSTWQNWPTSCLEPNMWRLWKSRWVFQLLQVKAALFTLTYSTFTLGFFLQIHANCRIRRVYFTNRIYADKDLPKAFKVNVVEESKATPGKTAKADDKPTRSGDQDRINELNKQIGAPLPTSVADYIRGIQSVLNSVEKDPLRFWKKKVSVYKTIES